MRVEEGRKVGSSPKKLQREDLNLFDVRPSFLPPFLLDFLSTAARLILIAL